MRTNDHHDRFPIAKRGYDPNAVEAFLELASSENDRMLDEAASQIAALQVELEEARKQEEAVHLTILAATKAKEDMLAATQHQIDQQAAQARKEGDRIVTDARMQAFKLVTGAREEAETIVGDARIEAAAITRFAAGTAKAEATAPSINENALQARIEAMQGVIQAMEHELATRPTAANPLPIKDASAIEPVDADDDVIQFAAKADPTDELEDVEHLEIDEDAVAEDAVAEDAVAEDAVAEDDIAEDDIEVVVSDALQIDHVDDAETTIEDEPVITIEPAIDEVTAASVTPETDASTSEEPTPAGKRRSFYSRRSAKLPQIGTDAGRGAMAAVAGLRTSVMAPEHNESTDSEESPALEAEVV